MKILDAGDHPLSNADVLDWVKRKRAQHVREDEEDKSKGNKPLQRPPNFIRVLERTERELMSDKYPYKKNPSAYVDAARRDAFRDFVLEVESAIQGRLEEEWKDRLANMTPEQIDRTFEPTQEQKSLTPPELLMLYNHAPTCVEMLQPMLESVEDRFKPEEQQVIVDVVVRTLRCDEIHTNGVED